MDIGALFNELSNDPRFIKLPYNRQQNVWATVLSKQLSRDPKFHALPPNSQKYVFNKYLIQPPAMENKQFQQRISQIGEGVRATDQRAISEATTIGYWGRMLQNSVILGTAKKLYEGLVNVGLDVANKIDPNVPWKTFGDVHKLPDKGQDLIASCSLSSI